MTEMVEAVLMARAKEARADCKFCGGSGLVEYTIYSRSSGDKLVEGQWTCPDCTQPEGAALEWEA